MYKKSHQFIITETCQTKHYAGEKLHWYMRIYLSSRLLCRVARRMDPCVPTRCGMHKWNYSCHWCSISQSKWCKCDRKPISSTNGSTPHHHPFCGYAVHCQVAAPLVVPSRWMSLSLSLFIRTSSRPGTVSTPGCGQNDKH